jgi:hypothetical protein
VIEPQVSLAVTFANAPSAYAILAGSGISRPAGVLTGAAVLEDLIRQVAVARGDADPAEPLAWFQDTYGKVPSYSTVLQALSSRASGRAELLKRYFEPTDEERAQGRKVPTTAHRAVARLAAEGRLRVILTTNFDPLFEEALTAAGVPVTVVRGARDVPGMVPLGRDTCTLLKVHGDYRDTATLNTPGELARYPRPMLQLLRRIFTEYGLLILGWSGESDVALAEAMRSSPRRYPWYFATRSDPSEAAQRLITDCDMHETRIVDADHLMTNLQESLNAIYRLRVHPLAPKVAAARLKSSLPDPIREIEAADLVETEIDSLTRALTLERFPCQAPAAPTAGDVSIRLADYDALSDTVAHLMAVMGAWASERHLRIVGDGLRTLLRAVPVTGGYTVYTSLQYWPAYRIFFAAGVAATKARNDAVIATLWDAAGTSMREHRRLYTPLVIEGDAANQVLQLRGYPFEQYYPHAPLVCASIRDALRAVCPNDAEFIRVFDLFEYILAALDEDEFRDTRREGSGMVRPSRRLGPFANRVDWSRIDEKNRSAWGLMLESELRDQGSEWPLLAAGAFGKDPTRAMDVIMTLDGILEHG